MIILYSNHCPMCIMLAAALQHANIPFETNSNTDFIIEKGFKSMPILFNGEEYLTAPAAMKWIKTQSQNNEKRNTEQQEG